MNIPSKPNLGDSENLSLVAVESPAAKAAYLDLFLRSMDAILLLDITSGKIIEANDASNHVFRVPVEKLQGSTIFQYCREDELAQFKKLLRIASRRYHPKTFELPFLVGNPTTEISVEVAASPLKLRDGGGEVLQIICRDITEKKEAERKIAAYIQEIEKANKKLEELATTDGMTGLINFRHFSKLLELEHTRAARHKSNYAIVFCDIDHFKKYNDQNGHPAGDALLKSFADILKRSVRNIDVPARYGGEEFVILCPETDVNQACTVAERIRSRIAATKFENGEKQPMGFVSVSVGVASFPANGNDHKAVLQAADDALYISKSSGRNRVTLNKGPK